jgi:glycosyltransferase involved in cell wall biosynthesis
VKIVIIIIGQPSTNPRTVKEYSALSANGHQVKVLYGYWIDWAVLTDTAMFQSGVLDEKDFYCIGGSKVKKKYLYYLSAVFFKTIHFLNFWLGITIFSEWCLNRPSFFLMRAAKKHEADLYIAHNLSALPAAALAAKKNNAPYAFDAEDYHRGQVEEYAYEYKFTKRIEDKYLPGVVYCSAASPGIAEKYAAHYPGLDPVVINNVFSKQYLQPQPELYQKGELLKLFWFSQTVGKGRGLEEMIKVMGLLKNIPLHFTILGDCSAIMRNYLLELATEAGIKEDQLHFIDPVALEDIFRIAAEHHIGLAIETGYNINYQIALTNKLFVYLLSNLAVLATNTPAQQQFLDSYAGIGRYYTIGDTGELAAIIEKWYNDPEALNTIRNRAHEIAATKLNWEEEQKIFLQLVDKAMLR